MRLKHTNSRHARKPAITPYQKTSECVAKSLMAKYKRIRMLVIASMPITGLLVIINSIIIDFANSFS